MPNYEWIDNAFPWERFPDWAVGAGLWKEYGPGIPETLPTLLAALVYARGDQPAGLTGLVCPRLFISHKREDEDRARDIAALANQAGFEYWLDVLDSSLKLVNSKTRTAADTGREIATIIEMALLNSSHVLAVLTKKAETSRWVPYEYGRVKDSSLFSSKAACWIDTDVKTQDLAEYMLLGTQTRSDAEISQWLRSELTTWRSINPACVDSGEGPALAATLAPPAPTRAPATSKDEVLARLIREYNAGLEKPITVRPPLVLKKPSP